MDDDLNEIILYFIITSVNLIKHETVAMNTFYRSYKNVQELNIWKLNHERSPKSTINL